MNTVQRRGSTRIGQRGTKFLLLAGFLAASIRLAHSSEAPTLIERPNAESGPTQISVAIWFVDINSHLQRATEFRSARFQCLALERPSSGSHRRSSRTLRAR